MHSNFSLKFKIADIFVIATSLIVSIALLVVILLINNPYQNQRYVEITHQNTLIDKIDIDDLSEQKIIILKKEIYPKLLDDFTIYIDPKKGIKVDESVSCPNHICSKQGWVNILNLPIICIPNDVSVVITTSSSNGSTVIGEIFYEKKNY